VTGIIFIFFNKT